jgi:hypothetical protein
VHARPETEAETGVTSCAAMACRVECTTGFMRYGPQAQVRPPPTSGSCSRVLRRGASRWFERSRRNHRSRIGPGIVGDPKRWRTCARRGMVSGRWATDRYGSPSFRPPRMGHIARRRGAGTRASDHRGAAPGMIGSRHRGHARFRWGWRGDLGRWRGALAELQTASSRASRVHR